jgi:hypothetical protein
LVRVFQSFVILPALLTKKNPETKGLRGNDPDPFSGMFNVARNLVTKRHGRAIARRRAKVNAVLRAIQA